MSNDAIIAPWIEHTGKDWTGPEGIWTVLEHDVIMMSWKGMCWNMLESGGMFRKGLELIMCYRSGSSP